MKSFEQAIKFYENNKFEQAFKIFLELAEQGDVSAQVSVACMFDHGQGVERNLEAAIHWYKLAAEAGHHVAQNNYPMALFQKDPAEAIPQLLAMTKVSNSPLIRSVLGDIYSSGFKLPERLQSQYSDDVMALEWYLQAGDGGNPYGYQRLAEMYLEGRGCERNAEKAIFYLERAADMDYAEPVRSLVRIYEEGLPGISPDADKAAFWKGRLQQLES